MPYSQDFVACKAFFYEEETGKKLGQATIVKHDRINFLITVTETSVSFEGQSRVLLLILTRGQPQEYMGTVRHRTSMGTREIALFKGRAKEDRSSCRYTVNTPARVEQLLISGRLLPLPKPVDAVVLNVSTTGVLLRARANALNVGTSFQLKMDIDGSVAVLNTTVVRIDPIDKISAEYGCKFR